MLTILFIIAMCGVFGKLLAVSIKMTWGIVKVLSYLVFLPIVLIVLAASGLIYIAFPVLMVIGLVALIKPAFD